MRYSFSIRPNIKSNQDENNVSWYTGNLDCFYDAAGIFQYKKNTHTSASSTSYQKPVSWPRWEAAHGHILARESKERFFATRPNGSEGVVPDRREDGSAGGKASLTAALSKKLCKRFDAFRCVPST